jgi:hypothetical protein
MVSPVPLVTDKSVSGQLCIIVTWSCKRSTNIERLHYHSTPLLGKSTYNPSAGDLFLPVVRNDRPGAHCPPSPGFQPPGHIGARFLLVIGWQVDSSNFQMFALTLSTWEYHRFGWSWWRYGLDVYRLIQSIQWTDKQHAMYIKGTVLTQCEGSIVWQRPPWHSNYQSLVVMHRSWLLLSKERAMKAD